MKHLGPGGTLQQRRVRNMTWELRPEALELATGTGWAWGRRKHDSG